MKRTKFNLPDAINCSLTKNFTQVPTTLLRNPNISSKAKSILCLLLSNKGGWRSHLSTIQTMMKEKRDALQSGLRELEEHGYLIRLQYRNKETKKWSGSFWAYTDLPDEFDIKDQLDSLRNKGLEPCPGFPGTGSPGTGNQRLNILSIKKTKKEEENIMSDSENLNGQITSSQFEKFWKLYPRKVDKGKALTRWNSICSKPPRERPTWTQLKKAILKQKKSERWQDEQQTPHAATWLNQSRWLDDAAEMKLFKREETPKEVIEYGEKWYLGEDGQYRNDEGELLIN